MGVSVRLTRNTRVHVPFWVAIPAWLVIGAAWVLIGVIFCLAWLIGQAFSLATRGRVRPPMLGGRTAPGAAPAPDATGRWCGPVQSVTLTADALAFTVRDPARSQTADFRIPGPVHPDLVPMRPGDVVQVLMNKTGRNVQVDIVRRADGSTPPGYP